MFCRATDRLQFFLNPQNHLVLVIFLLSPFLLPSVSQGCTLLMLFRGNFCVCGFLSFVFLFPQSVSLHCNPGSRLALDLCRQPSQHSLFHTGATRMCYHAAKMKFWTFIFTCNGSIFLMGKRPYIKSFFRTNLFLL